MSIKHRNLKTYSHSWLRNIDSLELLVSTNFIIGLGFSLTNCSRRNGDCRVDRLGWAG
jgi:hypothetical protein